MSDDKKRYQVTYFSAPTGYGWTEDCDDDGIDFLYSFIRSTLNEYTSHIDVWDRTIHEWIVKKSALEFGYEYRDEWSAIAYRNEED